MTRMSSESCGDGWRLYRGDCLAGMRELGDKSVDCVITDPPYSAGLYEKYRGSDERNHTRLRLLSNSIGSIEEILDDCAKQIRRITRRWSVVFSDVEICHRWRVEFGDDYIRTGAWVKTNPMPQISGDRPASGMETVTIAHPPGRKRWNGGGKAATWKHPTCQGRERPEHPCPKPLSLMRELIEDFTDPGDLVLDPFAGSGSTGVACRQLGRRFLGWELNPEYFDIASSRLRGEEATPRPEQPSFAFGERP